MAKLEVVGQLLYVIGSEQGRLWLSAEDLPGLRALHTRWEQGTFS